MKKLGILTVLIAIALFCGCSTKPKGTFTLSPRQVTIRTEPEGARVMQSRPLNQPPLDLGVTPLIDRPVTVMTGIKMKHMPLSEAQRFFEHANNLVVLIEKDGYEPHRATFVTNTNETAEYSVKLIPKPQNSNAP